MSEIFIQNTLSGKKEVFKPVSLGRVGMYHCGPTVYWDQHIGNIRAVVLNDLMRQVFVLNGYNVNLTRNYTDVGHLTGDNIGSADSGEDRMEKASKRENLSPEAIAEKYIKRFDADTEKMNVEKPTHAPRATDHIKEMIDMVSVLIEKGFAYVTPEAVYFDVKKFPDYTKLSRQKVDELAHGEGFGSVEGVSKRDPRDFALWFLKTGAHKDALQTWPSPWGVGFPGWHIECSAMSKKYLGDTLDVHMGGIEHVSIHHTNEIAQSECANGVTFVNYWVHNEHLVVDGKKMSKSEGTSYLVSDIEERGFPALSLRYFFLSAHYRSKQNFTWQSLEAAHKAMKRLAESVSVLPGSGKVNEKYADMFKEAVNDDFNIPAGLALVWDILKDKAVSDADKRATIVYFDKVFRLGLGEEKTEKKSKEDTMVADLVKERELARLKKDWKKSDLLRLEIEKMGFEVKDTSNGPKISRK